jgi:hypothetical protein
VVKTRGHHCGDVELGGYGPTASVRYPYGQLRYPNNLDQSLNDEDADKVRKYRSDYNMTLLQLQEFSFRKQIVDSSTTSTCLSLSSSKAKLVRLSLRRQLTYYT